jgi:putative transposase
LITYDAGRSSNSHLRDHACPAEVNGHGLCDHGSNFTAAFDVVLADAGIRTVLCNIRTPRMNAIAERWIGLCRRELLDRTLIWNPAHLRRILRDHETHHNQHRPHRALNGAAPLKPLPGPVDLDRYRIRKQAQVGGLINEYRLVA